MSDEHWRCEAEVCEALVWGLCEAPPRQLSSRRAARPHLVEARTEVGLGRGGGQVAAVAGLWACRARKGGLWVDMGLGIETAAREAR